MAQSDEEKRKDDFCQCLDSLTRKPNSQLITDEKAGRIRRVLSGNGDAESARFRFYVKSKGFAIVYSDNAGVVFSVADVSLSSADSRDRRFSADALASSSPL